MKKTKFFLPFFALALTFGVIGCSQNENGGNTSSGKANNSTTSVVPAKPRIAVSAADNKTSLEIEETVQLTAKNGTEVITGVTWASSDATIASVSTSGLVTAIKKGDVTITATKDGFNQGTISINVKGPEIIVQVESGTSEGNAVTFKDSHNVDTDMVDQWPQNAVLTLAFTAKKAGAYELHVFCRAHGGYQSTNTDVFADTMEVKINDAAVTLSGQAEGGTFTDYTMGDVTLNQGNNTMTVKNLAADNEISTIDYFMFVPKA